MVKLGVGMDLTWGGKYSFQANGYENIGVAPRVKKFLKNYGEDFSHIFFAFQPKDRQELDAKNYFPAYDDLFSSSDMIPIKAMHQTMLNMGSLENYDRVRVLKFTNEVVARYDLAWVVEDIGIWSIKNKVMPYPLAPVLNEESLKQCIKNVAEVKNGLDTRLCIEFPGFTDGTNFFIGKMHAFDFFRRLAEACDVSVTIDIGHIISYQWLLGKKGIDIYEDISRLPLENCFEIHMSGCSIVNGCFRDAHHGILLDQQIEMLEFVLPLCKNLQAITYEDPRYTEDGLLIEKSLVNYFRLKEMVKSWCV